MNPSKKRIWSGLVAIATAAAVVPLLGAPTAGAVGTPQTPGSSIRTAGGAAPLTSGDSGTTFTLRLPAGASCTGDSANDGYRVQSYMVPESVDPSTLTFNGAGPVPLGMGASFRQPLYDINGSGFVDQQTANASSPGGPGPILAPPDFNFGAVFVPGNIPSGTYNLGIACTLGPASATQMKEFWNTQMVVTTAAPGTGGPAEFNWAVPAPPVAPVLTAVAAADAQLTATFTHTPSGPPSDYTATATPTADPDCAGATPVTTTPTASAAPIAVTGLTNTCEYSVTVTAANTLGSATSNAILGTPNPARPQVQNLTVTPGVERLDVNWDYVTNPPAFPATTGFSVTISPNEGTVDVDDAATSAQITGLTPGTLYDVTVTPLYAAPPPGTSATVLDVTPNSNQTLEQHLEVTRPLGALVLTQVCGKYGALPAAPASPGFPDGLPAVTAAGTGSAPFQAWDETAGTGAEGSNPDGVRFTDYPYPVDANNVPDVAYPTHCGVDLGKGKFITSGPGAGQYFAASGRLNQVTIVDTRDTDTGWSIVGTMGTFSSGTDSFSGNHLGWNPTKTSSTPAFDDDLDPSTPDYLQSAVPGAVVDPRTAPSGLAAGKSLGSASNGSGLGIAVYDAYLKLLIPVTATNGLYEGTLTFTVA